MSSSSPVASPQKSDGKFTQEFCSVSVTEGPATAAIRVSEGIRVTVPAATVAMLKGPGLTAELVPTGDPPTRPAVRNPLAESVMVFGLELATKAIVLAV